MDLNNPFQQKIVKIVQLFSPKATLCIDTRPRDL
jgi:hypothetical protein